MGLPQILINFTTLAETLVTRSERGIVAVILKDNSNTTTSYSYESEKDIVSSHWTTTNKGYLSLAFMGNPSKVIVERVAVDGDIGDALTRLKTKTWTYLTIPGIESDDISDVVTYINTQRTDYHKSFKAVLPNATADSEGIVNFATDNIKVGAKTYTTAEFCTRIAGVLAGVSLNQSATYYALPEIDSITESETPDDDVDNGKLILINDGAKIKIARAVNSLTTVTDTKGDDFKKIKIIEALDMLRDDIRLTFEDDFVGKVENSYDNKVLFIAAINKYFAQLMQEGVLYSAYDNKAEIDIEGNRKWLKDHNKPVDTMDDETIKTANTGTTVFIKANIQVQDAIEDLSFTVYMN